MLDTFTRYVFSELSPAVALIVGFGPAFRPKSVLTNGFRLLLCHSFCAMDCPDSCLSRLFAPFFRLFSGTNKGKSDVQQGRASVQASPEESHAAL